MVNRAARAFAPSSRVQRFAAHTLKNPNAHDPLVVGSLETIAQLDQSRIAISHFNDSPSSPPREQQHDPDRVMPGDGIYDLKRYCDLLRQTGYNRWLSLELFRPDLYEQDPKEVARIGLEKMRAVAEA